MMWMLAWHPFAFYHVDAINRIHHLVTKVSSVLVQHDQTESLMSKPGLKRYLVHCKYVTFVDGPLGHAPNPNLTKLQSSLYGITDSSKAVLGTLVRFSWQHFSWSAYLEVSNADSHTALWQQYVGNFLSIEQWTNSPTKMHCVAIFHTSRSC